MEIRGDFQIGERSYSVFIIKRAIRTEVFLFETSSKSKFMNPVPIKISTSTYKETIEYWLMRLELYLAKHLKERSVRE